MSPERNTKGSEQLNRSREDKLDAAIPDISSVVFIILKLCFLSSRNSEMLVSNANVQVW